MNWLKFFGLKILEIAGVIYIPYYASFLSQPIFKATKMHTIRWVDGVLTIFFILLALVLIVIILWLLYAILLNLLKGILVWIHWNWRLATGKCEYEEGGTLKWVDKAYKWVENVMSKFMMTY